MAMTPEGKVKAKVRRILDRYGADIYTFMPVQSGLGARTLDMLICVRGHFLAIETKRPGQVPTKLQELCMRTIQAAGGTAIAVDGTDESYLRLEQLLASLTKNRDVLRQEALKAG